MILITCLSIGSTSIQAAYLNGGSGYKRALLKGQGTKNGTNSLTGLSLNFGEGRPAIRFFTTLY